MNHLPDCVELRNRYFVLRHGHSEANERGIIVSHPENGIDHYGLTDTGRSQVIRTLNQAGAFASPARIISSDFKRARETAELAQTYIQSQADIHFEPRLRERNFGRLELEPDSRYPEIWHCDSTDPDSHHMDSESANQVMGRVTSMVENYECSEVGTVFILVSHGDALQILQTAFNRQPASMHREQQHLETAELRELKLRIPGSNQTLI